MQKGYCLNELQQIVEITATEDQGTLKIVSGELHGKKIAKEFFYENKDDANKEIAERHSRLHEAFKNLDLVACLSINKEPKRKLDGLNRQELQDAATKDKKSYKNWLDKLQKSWEEINHERPDLEKLAKTLRNANLIQKALENPLAVDFIEIMAKEAKIKKAKAKAPPHGDDIQTP
jgi:hypothetical protein